jgi:hypothetical protein
VRLRSVTTPRVYFHVRLSHIVVLTYLIAQIAAKEKAKANGRDLTQDEIEEDEDDELLTSLVPGGEIEKRHHTKGTLLVPLQLLYDANMFIAQIAAKEKAKANARDVEVEEREAHHTKGMEASSF